MNTRRPFVAAIAAAALAFVPADSVLPSTALGAPPVVHAAPATTHWTRISGPVGAGQQLGLAPTKGELNVFWNRKNQDGTSATIFRTRISDAGRVLGTSTVASQWDGVGGLAGLGDGNGDWVELRATGGYEPGLPPAQVGIYTLAYNDPNVAVTPAPGLAPGWALANTPGNFFTGPELFGGPPAAAASFVSWAGGLTAWAAAGGANVAGAGTQPVCDCQAISADLAYFAGSNLRAVVGETIGNPAGTYVQRLPVWPEMRPGLRTVLPSATQTMGDYGTAESNQSLYVAWSNANRPGVTKPSVNLTRFSRTLSQKQTRTIALGRFTVAKVFRDPRGDERFWLVWGDDHAVFATRSNKTGNRFEPVQELEPPAGTSFLWNAQGIVDFYVGPLELFVDAAEGSDRGFWYTRVLPQASLRAGVTKAATGQRLVTLELRDAGDFPWGSVQVVITFPDRHKLTLKAQSPGGRAQFTTDLAGKFTATASPIGYRQATTTFTLR